MAWHTALVLHPDCGRHDTGWRHPEHQGRLPALVQAVAREMPVFLPIMHQEEAALASVEDIRRVHTPELVDTVRGAVARAQEQGTQVALDGDTIASGATWDAALGAAGSVIAAARIVADGVADTAFAAARPPGHHASAGRAMGFCFFNNVAVAARWLQQERGIERIAIVDWDVHHGNGTQDIFYADPSVYYLSLHLADHYPGTGHAHERGSGAGAGTTLNVPLAHGTSRSEYLRAYRDALDRMFGDFAPGFVLVSAGFDCLAGDPLGGLPLEPEDLHAMTAQLMAQATSAHGRVVAALEGGYVPARVGAGTVAVLRALAGLPT